MNFIRLKTLIWKETYRFLKVWLQTVLSPVVLAIMYFAVFGGALGSRIPEVNGISYAIFIIPGLVLLQSTTNSFNNPSSSLIIAKYNGNISDLLLPPLSALEKTLGFLLGGISRGLMVAFLIFITAGIFTGKFFPEHWGFFFLMLFFANGIFALLGTLLGIWAKNFDQIAGFSTFVITPMGFLGAIFYSLDMLPPMAQTISKFNPFFYLADGLKWSFLNIAEVDPFLSFSISGTIFFILFGLTYWAFDSGWRLKV
jgi:ABC-2 type transport system permease protein